MDITSGKGIVLKMSNYTNIAKKLSVTRWANFVQCRFQRVRCCECEKLIELRELAICCYPNTKLVYVHYTCIDAFIKHKIEELFGWKKEIEIKKMKMGFETEFYNKPSVQKEAILLQE